MSNFNNKSITNKGLELLSAAMAGGKLEFTRIVMGSGAYSGDIGLIENLVSQKQSLDIKSITRKGSQVVLSTTLLQSAITEDFYWKEIGVYAKGADNLEVLYMYGSATDTSFISKDMLNEKMINVGVLVSNAQNITATIDGSLIYLSRVDLEEHDNSKTAHAPLIAWVQSLFDSLKLTWDSITGKPDTFPPSSHGHKASEITGLPTSLPANGGNADTVDGYHATSFSMTGHNHNGVYLPNPSAGSVSEMGQYIDLHKSGSSADYDGRVHVNALNQIVHVDADGSLAINYEISNLKSTVVSGKQSVANAINGILGTSLSNQTTFDDMAYYINSMSFLSFTGDLIFGLGATLVDDSRFSDTVTTYSIASNAFIVWTNSSSNKSTKLTCNTTTDAFVINVTANNFKTYRQSFVAGVSQTITVVSGSFFIYLFPQDCVFTVDRITSSNYMAFRFK